MLTKFNMPHRIYETTAHNFPSVQVKYAIVDRLWITGFRRASQQVWGPVAYQIKMQLQDRMWG